MSSQVRIVKRRKTCTRCNKVKPTTMFSWQDKAHRWRDCRCRSCRAVLQSQRRKPKRAVKQYKFPRGLHVDLHDHLTSEQCAYIAGIIDGEGSIWSSQPLNNKRPLVLSVAMIHRPTIEWLHAMCGGNVNAHKSNQNNARQSWAWRLHGVRTASLLRRVLDYMQTKHEEAEVALILASTMWMNNVRGKVTEETLKKRRFLGQKLRNLKRREWTT